MTLPAHHPQSWQNTYPTPPPVFPVGRTLGWLAAYAGALVGANALTASYGMIPVGFGQTATAGTVLAGVALMVRNTLQDLLGRRGVMTAVLIGSLLSALVAPPALAFASAASVLVAESADMSLYTPLRRRGWVRAVVPATLLGAFLDTLVFLTIAGFPVWAAVPGQMTGKAWAVAVPVLLVLLCRSVGPRAGRVRRLARNWVSRS
ncbi:VUT family protein [Streptomyces sp. NBC_00237]|uniref:VUT family protein n=1 Tax=Streptomyces sp. NBC_00237 TaxID=2975687 RepID=UPI0022505EC4|nr:VUT family protein [Streptomyces sp. NBC_00237]MCX5206757.1 VUT family protein [Streptomyces sp. NBC_00237]